MHRTVQDAGHEPGRDNGVDRAGVTTEDDELAFGHGWRLRQVETDPQQSPGPDQQRVRPPTLHPVTPSQRLGLAEPAHHREEHCNKDRNPLVRQPDDAKQPDFRINLVADISCDIDGPVASTIRPSTIADPFYGYDPHTETEVAFDADEAITVMAVDNLPCELPKDASEGFGEMFLEHVIPAFFNGDQRGILKRARITTADGKLTQRFSYLQEYVDFG